MRRLVELPQTLWDVWRVLRILPRIESARRDQGPRELVALARQLGSQAPPRGAQARRCLRRAIHWVDRSLADGGNCCRRALLEMALDPTAAGEPFAMGFSRTSRALSGHAWVQDHEPADARYDFVIQL